MLRSARLWVLRTAAVSALASGALLGLGGAALATAPAHATTRAFIQGDHEDHGHHQGKDEGHQGKDEGHQGKDEGHQGKDEGHQGKDEGHQGKDEGHHKGYGDYGYRDHGHCDYGYRDHQGHVILVECPI
jgi:hypothetical protein